MTALTAYLFCGMAAPTTCKGSSSGDGGLIAAGVVVTGAVVATAVAVPLVIHGHHTLKGCVTEGEDGLQIEDTGNQLTYALTGLTPDVKAGDHVSLHGLKIKAPKGSKENPTFNVTKINKDYGPCQAKVATADKPAM